jgi:hypothetical protein
LVTGRVISWKSCIACNTTRPHENTGEMTRLKVRGDEVHASEDLMKASIVRLEFDGCVVDW